MGLKATFTAPAAWGSECDVLFASDVPEAHGAVAAGRGQPTTVRAKGRPGHGPRVAADGAKDSARFDVPDMDDARAVGGGDAPAIGGEGGAQHRSAMAPVGVHKFSTCRLPDLDAVVEAGGDQVLAVGAEGNAAQVARAAQELTRCRLARSQTIAVPSHPAEASCRPSGLKATLKTLALCPSRAKSCSARIRVPEANLAIRPGGRQTAAVRAVRHAEDARASTSESVVSTFARRRFPDLDFSGLGPPGCRRRRQPSAVWAKGDAHHRAGVAPGPSKAARRWPHPTASLRPAHW